MSDELRHYFRRCFVANKLLLASCYFFCLLTSVQADCCHTWDMPAPTIWNGREHEGSRAAWDGSMGILTRPVGFFDYMGDTGDTRNQPEAAGSFGWSKSKLPRTSLAGSWNGRLVSHNLEQQLDQICNKFAPRSRNSTKLQLPWIFARIVDRTIPNSGGLEPIIHTPKHNDGLKPKIPGNGGEKLLFVRVVARSMSSQVLFMIVVYGLSELVPGDRQQGKYEAHCLGCLRNSRQARAEEDSNDENPVPTSGCSRKAAGFFPHSLALLFGGDINKPVERLRREQFTREALLMELLAAEESDEAPDNGALSRSGDKYEE
ncbi:hypothetical protein B0H14DRAFT_2639893 [Mycena olivaceomarginata]|nr:hypothetical protein B0H14DRAFT_2639893 [Mycena olivaceomarginata]